MKIKEALLKELSIRVSNSNGRWLVIDELYVLGGEYVVYEKYPYAKRTTEMYRGADEEVAVSVLLDNKEYVYAEELDEWIKVYPPQLLDDTESK